MASATRCRPPSNWTIEGDEIKTELHPHATQRAFVHSEYLPKIIANISDEQKNEFPRFDSGIMRYIQTSAKSHEMTPP